MKSIDEYIKLSYTMENKSDGGSPAFIFEDAVLVRYSTSVKYGPARKGEEEIAKEINVKRSKGVRSPYHYAIKREIEDDRDICWVLQEKSRGKNLAQFEHLELQEALLKAPASHYENLAKDICELMDMGIELKPKNIFYDAAEDGGFYIIDLLSTTTCEFDPKNLAHLFEVFKLCKIAAHWGYEYDNEQSRLRQNKIQVKVFKGCEEAIPTFKKARKWMFRFMNDGAVQDLKDNMVDIPDLEFSEADNLLLEKKTDQILEECMQKLESGKYELWQIDANEIRNSLIPFGTAFRFYTGTRYENIRAKGDYDNCKALEYQMMDLFIEMLKEKCKHTDSPYLINALKEVGEYENAFSDFKQRIQEETDNF